MLIIFAETNNVKVENKNDKAEINIGYIKDGSYVTFKKIHTPKNAKTFEISIVSAGSGGTINVIANDGKLLTSLYAGKTVGWQKWEVKKIALDKKTVKNLRKKMILHSNLRALPATYLI